MSGQASTNRYVLCRDQLLRAAAPGPFAPVLVRDAESGYVPVPVSERLVQCIWYDQRLATTGLQTVDGRTVRVLFQGWWNLEAGPDFHHATIQIGDEPEQTGDIEIHLRGDDWFAHQHHRDPAYNKVVLHVVLWRAGGDHLPHTQAGELVPQLVLEDHLAAPLEVLGDEIDLDAYPYNARRHGGRCAERLPKVAVARLRELLAEAGDERFAAKQRRYARWLYRLGPDQAFHQAWFEALGYKANKTAFRQLAQRLPHDVCLRHRAHLPALLFGVANFLPPSPDQPGGGRLDAYTRALWDRWWKLRDEFADQIMPARAWNRRGLRPANHPHRRLGAAAVLLQRHRHLFAKVLGAIEADGDPARLFAAVADDYWDRHYTLAGPRQAVATSPLGAQRAREIVLNVILPFAAAWARQQANEPLAAACRARYQALPASGDHSAERLAGLQLFGSLRAVRDLVRSAREQQGLLQVFQDFCLHDKSGCERCGFPALVEQWT